MSYDNTKTINWEGYEVECHYEWDAPKVLLHDYTCRDKHFNRNYKGDYEVECQLCDLIAIAESEHYYDEGDKADEMYELSKED